MRGGELATVVDANRGRYSPALDDSPTSPRKRFFGPKRKSCATVSQYQLEDYVAAKAVAGPVPPSGSSFVADGHWAPPKS